MLELKNIGITRSLYRSCHHTSIESFETFQKFAVRRFPLSIASTTPAWCHDRIISSHRCPATVKRRLKDKKPVWPVTDCTPKHRNQGQRNAVTVQSYLPEWQSDLVPKGYV